MRRRSEPHTFGQRLEAQKQRLEREIAMLPVGQNATAWLRDSNSFRLPPRCTTS